MPVTNSNNLLLYFADPMCSWCWGFAPVLDEIKTQFSDQLQVALILGGLRPGTKESIDDNAREEILHHWHEVHKRSGQPFIFEGAMPKGFIYDTEPPSRAVVTLGELDPDSVLAYFKRIQSAFYAEQKDVTREDMLLGLLTEFDVDENKFLPLFQSQEMRDRTLAHFQRTRQMGIRGFPTVVLQKDKELSLLTHGYQSYEALEPQIVTWLK